MKMMNLWKIYLATYIINPNNAFKTYSYIINMPIKPEQTQPTSKEQDTTETRRNYTTESGTTYSCIEKYSQGELRGSHWEKQKQPINNTYIADFNSIKEQYEQLKSRNINPRENPSDLVDTLQEAQQTYEPGDITPDMLDARDIRVVYEHQGVLGLSSKITSVETPNKDTETYDVKEDTQQ